MYRIIDLFKNLSSGEHLLPTNTGLTFWESVYTENASVIDREFARRFSTFKYFDFLDGESKDDATNNLKSDVLSILTFNKKRYEEMYRVFLVLDADDPITYNYDMIETTGAQHTETKYGQETFTKGSQSNTEGDVTNSHNVAPMNSTTPQLESSDVKTSQTFTDGQRIDTNAEHTDEFDSDAWTLTRRGNIGVQTAGDILRIHTQYWTEYYKFMQLIFDDICKQLLMAGE